jgi:hypothetical protein
MVGHGNTPNTSPSQGNDGGDGVPEVTSLVAAGEVLVELAVVFLVVMLAAQAGQVQFLILLVRL